MANNYPNPAAFREALKARMKRRGDVPEVPDSWPQQYEGLRDENSLPWENIDELVELVEQFVEPVLAGEADGRWFPGDSEWRTG
jgi:hypothetical protein